MCARELIFDQLLVLFAHGASCEYLAEITQSRGNSHQRYAKVTQLYFDRVEEPDSTHCPAPFLVCHNTYLIENMCERTNGYHRTISQEALPFGIEKKCYAEERHSHHGEWRPCMWQL